MDDPLAFSLSSSSFFSLLVFISHHIYSEPYLFEMSSDIGATGKAQHDNHVNMRLTFKQYPISILELNWLTSIKMSWIKNLTLEN